MEGRGRRPTPIRSAPPFIPHCFWRSVDGRGRSFSVLTFLRSGPHFDVILFTRPGGAFLEMPKVCEKQGMLRRTWRTRK